MKKIFCLLLCVFILCASCLTLAVPTPDPDGPVVRRAREELGKPYKWGGVGPDAYDAAGFVSYCLTGEHRRVGTVSTFLSWPRVSKPVPGDICVSENDCGIYIEPNLMIHIAGNGSVVSYGGIPHDMIFVRYPANVPPTGDSSPLLPLALLLCASFAGICLLRRRDCR